MSDYETRDERAALEGEFEDMPAENSVANEASSVVSVRLRKDELAVIERAANAMGMPISTFLRQAAVHAANPLDVRAASAQAEAVQDEVHKLMALLHGKAA